MVAAGHDSPEGWGSRGGEWFPVRRLERLRTEFLDEELHRYVFSGAMVVVGVVARGDDHFFFGFFLRVFGACRRLLFGRCSARVGTTCVGVASRVGGVTAGIAGAVDAVVDAVVGAVGRVVGCGVVILRWWAVAIGVVGFGWQWRSVTEFLRGVRLSFRWWRVRWA